MLKKTLLIFVILLAPLFLIFTLYLRFRQSQKPDQEAIRVVTFQDGDLIFRQGRSPESFLVCLADKEHDFSHLGLVVMEENQPFVIHAVPAETKKTPSRVIKEPVQAFLNDSMASHWAVYRSKFPLPELHTVAVKAREFFDRNIEFDDDYDLKTDGRLYCSELVLKAYQVAGLDPGKYPQRELRFVLGTKKILFPSAFIQSPDFFRVCSY